MPRIQMQMLSGKAAAETFIAEAINVFYHAWPIAYLPSWRFLPGLEKKHCSCQRPNKVCHQ